MNITLAGRVTAKPRKDEPGKFTLVLPLRTDKGVENVAVVNTAADAVVGAVTGWTKVIRKVTSKSTGETLDIVEYVSTNPVKVVGDLIGRYLESVSKVATLDTGVALSITASATREVDQRKTASTTASDDLLGS